MSTLEKTLKSVADLAAAGLVGGDDVARLEAVGRRYAIAITPAMAGLIEPGDAADPIGRQFLPDPRELLQSPGEHADPIGDHVHEKVAGLVHRYPDRVLLKLTHACPVYCRFCFRREMVGPGGAPPLVGDAFEKALAYIAAQPGIFEVIMTGGDPLMLAPRRLAEVTRRLGALPHIKVLRWHSRVPVVDPARISDELVGALAAPGMAVYVAVHTNHPREITDASRVAIRRLEAASLVLLGQTVLLRGINDDAATLEALFRTLVALGVRPYYLHHADLAPGTAHFRTSIAEGQALMRQLRGRLSGLALPTYVLDIPGGYGKVPVGPAYVDPFAGTVSDNDGGAHVYPPSDRQDRE